jgi:hypothetical protein
MIRVMVRSLGFGTGKATIGLSLWWSLSFLLAVLTAAASAWAELPLPDNFSYSVRIQLPLREKSNLGSGFFFRHGESTYLVTARHVLFAPTRVRVKDGASFAIPRRLVHRLRYHKASRLLALEGVLGTKERDEMISHPTTNESGKLTILDLYDKSQRLVLKAHEATVVTCEPGTGQLELRLTAMWIKGFVKYHPVQDVAIIKLEGPTGFVTEVQAKKPERLTALDAADLKRMDDVLPGSQILMLGFTYPENQPTSLKVRRPMLTKGTVEGKNEVSRLLALDCISNPGDSGGLVLQETGEGQDGKHLKGVGVVSGGFQYHKGGQDSKKYSLVIPIDALVELLSQ